MLQILNKEFKDTELNENVQIHFVTEELIW